ncbi:MAG: HlyD family secretion protein [Hyphomicrobiales bacterium]|nr:HlyD family secretion protein [Hyphomicrobiales bacterium]
MSDIVLERATAKLPTKAMSKHGFKWALAAGLAGLLATGAARYASEWWTVGRFLETTDDAYVGGNVTPISPHVAGFVAQILVADNEHVSAGQTLIRLDDRDFRAALDRATAVVAERQATLASLTAREQLQQSTIRAADADVEAKLAAAEFSKEEDARYRQLAQSSAGSQQNAQKALAANAVAQSAVSSSKAALAAARQQLLVLDAQIGEAGAAVEEAKADRRTAELNLGYTEIRSPIDGYVGNRAAQTGGYVSGGAYLVTVIPAHEIWVDANFKEDQLRHLTPGQAVSIVADTLPDHVFRGHVLSLSPGTGAIFSVIPPENATGNFTKIVQRVPVRIELDASDPELRALRPGLSTTVSVDTRSN